MVLLSLSAIPLQIANLAPLPWELNEGNIPQTDSSDDESSVRTSPCVHVERDCDSCKVIDIHAVASVAALGAQF